VTRGDRAIPPHPTGSSVQARSSETEMILSRSADTRRNCALLRSTEPLGSSEPGLTAHEGQRGNDMTLSCHEPKKTFRMRVAGADGDSGVTWNPLDRVSTEKARAFFSEHAGTVFLAFQDVQGAGYQIPPDGFDPAIHNDVVLMPVPVIG